MPESKWVREEDQPAMTCALASCERGGLGVTESYSVQIVRSHIDNFPRCTYETRYFTAKFLLLSHQAGAE